MHLDHFWTALIQMFDPKNVWSEKLNFAGHHEELVGFRAQGMARVTNEPRSILDTSSSAAEDWPSESAETLQERATRGGLKEARRKNP
ncbi:hypothetical protein G5I_13943 [Acromyrmex echinatior]|uniref:Uncharacterized protein n=1 Tax=Acromyrmex echinatior TaxID=103372 RepID=F4X6C7_ACREC|nr:hypothetical protein G5I_13943 [Acromyrmex echinatior]